MTRIDAACHKIADAIDALEAVCPSRAVSVAKTNLETALLWAQRASREAAPRGGNFDNREG